MAGVDGGDIGIGGGGVDGHGRGDGGAMSGWWWLPWWWWGGVVVVVVVIVVVVVAVAVAVAEVGACTVPWPEVPLQIIFRMCLRTLL